MYERVWVNNTVRHKEFTYIFVFQLKHITQSVNICMYVYIHVFTEFNKKKLYTYVPELACKWKDIGIQLLQAKHHNALHIIEVNHKGDIETCCREMIDKWLETAKNPKWCQLIKALQRASVSLNTLADKIKRVTKGN